MKRAGPDASSVTSPRHTEILNAYQSGESKFNAWTRASLGDIALLSWSFGRLTLLWTIDDRFVMPDGVMFGGHVASVSDHIAGLVAMSALDHSADRFRTSRLETQFFRPVMKPKARIEARAINVSKTLIHVEADFFNAEEKLAARMNAVQVRRRAE